MPTGPKGEKRPADVIGNAVRVMRIIATGGEPGFFPADDGKSPAAKSLGKKGGAAWARAMTPERRAEIAKKAALVSIRQQDEGDP
jgi:type IV secretory pathway TrbL component